MPERHGHVAGAQPLLAPVHRALVAVRCMRVQQPPGRQDRHSRPAARKPMHGSPCKGPRPHQHGPRRTDSFVGARAAPCPALHSGPARTRPDCDRSDPAEPHHAAPCSAAWREAVCAVMQPPRAPGARPNGLPREPPPARRRRRPPSHLESSSMVACRGASSLSCSMSPLTAIRLCMRRLVSLCSTWRAGWMRRLTLPKWPASCQNISSWKR
jgi:hypothetical protein